MANANALPVSLRHFRHSLRSVLSARSHGCKWCSDLLPRARVDIDGIRRAECYGTSTPFSSVPSRTLLPSDNYGVSSEVRMSLFNPASLLMLPVTGLNHV